MKKNGFLVMILILLASFVSAQTANQPEMAPRRLLLSVFRQQDAQITDNELLMVSRSLFARLQQGSAEIVVVEPAKDTALGGASQLTAEAEAAGADSWLSISVGGGWAALKIYVQSFDLFSQAMVADFSVARDAWSSSHDLALETWDDVVQPIVAHYHMMEGAAAPSADQQLAELTVTALPGTVVTGIGGSPLTIGQNGTGSLKVPTDREYVLRASLPGYAFCAQRIFLSSDRAITFSQAAYPQWTLETSLQDAAHPGAALSFHFSTGQGFIRIGATTCLVGIALNDTEVFSSQPLTNMFLQTGLYITRGKSPLSFYFGIGAFWRVVDQPGVALALDSLSGWGFNWVIGSEIDGPSGGRFFLEYTPTEYLTSVPDLLRASLGPYAAPPGWIFNAQSALNLFSLRIGYRWNL
ncbi:MAG: hypothetical protein ABSF77_17415 [Spirochaetia bacterium]|jgi:hypothetical protein